MSNSNSAKPPSGSHTKDNQYSVPEPASSQAESVSEKPKQSFLRRNVGPVLAGVAALGASGFLVYQYFRSNDQAAHHQAIQAERVDILNRNAPAAIYDYLQNVTAQRLNVLADSNHINANVAAYMQSRDTDANARRAGASAPMPQMDTINIPNSRARFSVLVSRLVPQDQKTTRLLASLARDNIMSNDEERKANCFALHIQNSSEAEVHLPTSNLFICKDGGRTAIYPDDNRAYSMAIYPITSAEQISQHMLGQNFTTPSGPGVAPRNAPGTTPQDNANAASVPARESQTVAAAPTPIYATLTSLRGTDLQQRIAAAPNPQQGVLLDPIEVPQSQVKFFVSAMPAAGSRNWSTTEPQLARANVLADKTTRETNCFAIGFVAFYQNAPERRTGSFDAMVCFTNGLNAPGRVFADSIPGQATPMPDRPSFDRAYNAAVVAQRGPGR